jgi:hypothetical protein
MKVHTSLMTHEFSEEFVMQTNNISGNTSQDWVSIEMMITYLK